jgi:hypothetical protein
MSLSFKFDYFSNTLIDVTRNPCERSIVPILDDIIPFPIPLITPPVTKIYFIDDEAVRDIFYKKRRQNHFHVKNKINILIEMNVHRSL